MVRKVEFVDPKCNEFRKGNHIKSRPPVTLTHILNVTISSDSNYGTATLPLNQSLLLILCLILILIVILTLTSGSNPDSSSTDLT